MKSLTIRLTAPLQSYGNEATFNRRTTDDYPSKSAIIGMIAAALGYRRDDSRINSLNKLLMAVRIDQPGKVLTDFHMVEYAQNSKKTKRKLTYRDYLQDAVFIVAIGSKDEDLIDRIEYALKHPYFQLSLGRRSNAPAGLLKMTMDNNDPLSILKELPWQASTWYQKKHHQPCFMAQVISDASLLPDYSSTLKKDQVGSFDQRHRFFHYRAVCQTTVKLKNKMYSPINTNHDIMSFL
ncbi:MAG: type I-E CRISPR-associated protein Cas5/CasD [Lactobacillus sp.]|jgi:CRISPR system Cascade subunit CasD|nr:type I-E CRISPR-associated protein Cas5/CasD [Lactobacillus sp.]MCI1974257.1 type I-E CRISPR-associated protein Cas5/CasD [Lactobacillus sp.]